MKTFFGLSILLYCGQRDGMWQLSGFGEGPWAGSMHSSIAKIRGCGLAPVTQWGNDRLLNCCYRSFLCPIQIGCHCKTMSFDMATVDAIVLVLQMFVGANLGLILLQIRQKNIKWRSG